MSKITEKKEKDSTTSSNNYVLLEDGTKPDHITYLLKLMAYF